MNDDMPATSNPLLNYLLQHGPWTVLASVLIASLMGWIPSPITAELERHERNQAQQINDLIRIANYNSAIIRAVCLVVADGNKEEVSRCQPIFAKDYEMK